MGKESEETVGPENLFSEWMKSTTGYWGAIFQFWQNSADSFRPPDHRGKESSSRTRASMDAAMKTFSAIASAMAEPEAMGSVLKGAGALPELLARAAITSLGGVAKLQEKIFEQAGRIGKSAETYTFEDLDENIFRTVADIYEKEFRQFFNIPQLGLTRLHQEKWLRAADKMNLFQLSLSEFLRLLQLPVSRSVVVLQEELVKLADAGELPEDSKKYYQMWIRILEGLYMNLFQSRDYIDGLAKTLDSMSEFDQARNEVIEGMIESLPIANQKDVDELAREIYLMKKRIRTLEKELRKKENPEPRTSEGRNRDE